MSKPVFNPTQYELRNELPSVVSAEQLAQITQVTDRVNVQLNWVAQILGWNGPNYWGNLPSTVAQKRALLGGSYGVYDGFTLLRLKEVHGWVPSIITEKKPNIAIGQQVIIGDQQAFIYDLTEGDDYLELDIGPISDEILSLLEGGAAIKVNCPANRPFPFYRPEPLASGDAEFRCSTGELLRSTTFYDYYQLVLSPFSQDGIVLDYVDLELYGGSYYYFDRAVYLAITERNLSPWVECQWVESKGLWQLYVPPEAIGNTLSLVWGYATPERKSIAYKSASIIAWKDPSDWGEGGEGFNPVLDPYLIQKSYNVAGLNFSLGSFLYLGDQAPSTTNPLWFDAGSNILYSYFSGQWIETGVATAYLNLQDESSPPPYTYDLQPGTIWQSPEGRVFVWDAGYQPPDFFYFFPNGLIDGFFYIDPSYQNVQGLYIFNPDSFYIHNPNGITSEGFIFFNCSLNEEGFYVNSPDITQPDWYEISFFDQPLFTSVFSPVYGSYLSVNLDGEPVPNFFTSTNYELNWRVEGDFLYINYKALTTEGRAYPPSITVSSSYGANSEVIDISDDFVSINDVVTSVPYNERGPLNNFRGVWGNKGGARALDFVFDALDIHGFDEREALHLAPLDTLVNFDWMLHQVTGKQCFVGDQPPASAKVGDYYWNNETGSLAVYYKDRDNSLIWVEVNYPISPCALGVEGCNYFPLKPILTTGSCVLDNGDMWQDPVTPGVALYYEGLSLNSVWVEVNWDYDGGLVDGWPFSEPPDPEPDFSVLNIYVSDDLVKLTPDELYVTDDYEIIYSIVPTECAYRFQYIAISDKGVQQFPSLWVGPKDLNYEPVSISEQVFSDAKFFIAPAVQNAGSTLRPWKTRSLEVATPTTVDEEIYDNPLIADLNRGPGDENWDRSFIRLPSEYGRKDSVWNKAKLAVQDFTYGGTNGALKMMQCPTEVVKPQLYDEVAFYKRDPSVGTVLYSESFIYSDVEGFFNLTEYFAAPLIQTGEFAAAEFDFVFDYPYDEWYEANLSDYEPLNIRSTLPNGDWDGVYVEPTGNRPLSGFVTKDLRVKSAIPVPAPVWDASIYKYAPLCPEAPVSFAEDPNNCKVGYAYFAADLAAAEDGFFNQQSDVAWREPLVKDQSLYITT